MPKMMCRPRFSQRKFQSPDEQPERDQRRQQRGQAAEEEPAEIFAEADLPLPRSAAGTTCGAARAGSGIFVGGKGHYQPRGGDRPRAAPSTEEKTGSLAPRQPTPAAPFSTPAEVKDQIAPRPRDRAAASSARAALPASARALRARDAVAAGAAAPLASLRRHRWRRCVAGVAAAVARRLRVAPAGAGSTASGLRSLSCVAAARDPAGRAAAAVRGRALAIFASSAAAAEALHQRLSVARRQLLEDASGPCPCNRSPRCRASARSTSGR